MDKGQEPQAEPIRGPTVYECAEAKIRRNKAKIEELQLEIRSAQRRLANPAYAHMLEAERLANNAEVFMRTPLNLSDDLEYALDDAFRSAGVKPDGTLETPA